MEKIFFCLGIIFNQFIVYSDNKQVFYNSLDSSISGKQYYYIVKIIDDNIRHNIDIENSLFKKQMILYDNKFEKDLMINNCRFLNSISIDNCIFKGIFSLKGTECNELVKLVKTDINGITDLIGIKLKNKLEIDDCEFIEEMVIGNSLIQGGTNISNCFFRNDLRFEYAEIGDTAKFIGKCKFKKYLKIIYTKFNEPLYFQSSEMRNISNFRGTILKKRTEFFDVKFMDIVSFSDIEIYDSIRFNRSIFLKPINFRNANFNNNAIADFSGSYIMDTIIIGGDNFGIYQKYDFRLARLVKRGRIKHFEDKIINGAKIILVGPVEIIFHCDQIKFIHIADSLSYYEKISIIDKLKSSNIGSERYSEEVKFEIDYLLAKSLIGQKISSEYEKYSKLHPKYWGMIIYEITMGLGFKPFRLFNISIIIIIIISFVIYLTNKNATENSIIPEIKFEKKIHKNIQRVIVSLYFSFTTFISLKLDKKIVFTYPIKIKYILLFEWVIGKIILLLFLFASEPGSIPKSLNSIFN